MGSNKSTRSRLIGALVFGLIGFLSGAGTGIVGGIFGAIAGAGLFTTIGIVYGWSAGPDVASLFYRLLNLLRRK